MSKLRNYAYMMVKYMAEYRFLDIVTEKIKKIINKGLGLMTRFITFNLSQINKKRILITTFQGDFTCNPKYITLELLKDIKDYEIVWGLSKQAIAKGAKEEIDSRIIIIPKYTFEFYRALYTSKLCIVNSGACLGRPFFKKKDSIILQTWHGSMGIKRIAPDSYQGKDKKFWVGMTTKVGKVTKYILSNSTYENEIFRESFWYQSEILKYGHPRNDLFFNFDNAAYRKIKDNILGKYYLNRETKLLLYAPTFRDIYNFECYQTPDEELVSTLNSRFGGQWIIMKRLHPSLRKYNLKLDYRKNDNIICIDVTDYPDMQELMLIADIGITDYSSWIYDYMLMKRPGFIYAADIKEYNDGRGFYYPLEETPFPIAETDKELVNNILTFNEEKYQSDLEKFLIDKGSVEDGYACKRTVEKIHEIMQKGS